MQADKHIGYVRVSTIIQNTERQLDGISLDKVFEEKASAKDAKRPILAECVEFLREGDTLHVHSIDRLARNLRDLEQIVSGLNSKGVVVQFHKEGLTFTGEDNPTQTLLFQMIGAVAQFERSIIKERQREGIAIAKQKGKYKGRKAKLSEEQAEELRAQADKGVPKAHLAKEYGISRQTLYQYLKQ